jgi:hypothetical protein
MALVNPNIALSFRGLQLPPPTNALAQQAQLMQIQQAQMEMQRMRQTDEAMERIRQTAMQQGGPNNLQDIGQAFLSSPDKAHQNLGFQILQHVRAKDAYRQAWEGPAAPQPITEPSGVTSTPISTPEIAARSLGPVGTPAPVNALAPSNLANEARINRLLELGTPEAIQAAKLLQERTVGPKPIVVDGALVTPSGEVLYRAPAKPATPTLAETERIAQQLQDPTLPAEQRKILQARLDILTTREPKAPPAPRTPVAVVGPDGKPVLVSPEEAIGKTPAAAMEGLTPKEKQKREAAYPKSTSALKTTEQDIDQMVKDIQTLLTDPGLNSITGLVYGRTPSVTREGRRAQALYDKIIAKGGFQMLSNMRAASPTGGALGNVSDREGVQLRAAFAALDRTQDAADVKQVLTDLITQLGATKTNLREAYDLTYEYRTGGGGAPTSGGWSIVK